MTGTAVAIRDPNTPPQVIHALQIRVSETTGFVSVRCPCQEDAIETRSWKGWQQASGRTATNAIFEAHLAEAAKREAAGYTRSVLEVAK
jgi:hypothetical protein